MRPAVFQVATTLYHPVEGEYTFPPGSPDPGGLWTELPGGEAPGKATTEQAMKDLIEAHDKIEALQRQLMSAEHDKMNLANERDAANAAAAQLTQEVADLKAQLAIPVVDPAHMPPAPATDEPPAEAADAPEVNDKRTMETASERAAVTVPDNWAELPFFSQKAIAAKLTDQPVRTKDDVAAAIQAHLAKA